MREEIANLLSENHSDDNEDWDLPADHKPYVILVVGVNGVGKTTTIGKLAYQFKKAGKKVYLGAADTFRAAAVEQISIWGERVGVPVVKQQMGSDPASVAFDTLQSAKANGADVVLIDTAGRLHNKVNLMNELKKIKDVMKKVIPEAPDEVMLVWMVVPDRMPLNKPSSSLRLPISLRLPSPSSMERQRVVSSLVYPTS